MGSWRRVAACARLRNFRDLQVRVDGEMGIPDGRIRWRRRMPRCRLELHAGALDRVRVSIAPGAWQREGIRGNQLVQRNTTAVQGDIGEFRLRDLQQIAADAGQGDGLRRSGALIGGGHLLEIVVESAIENADGHKNDGQAFHTGIVGPDASPRKSDVVGVF